MNPLHLEDLKRSGLSDQTIIEAGIETVRPQDIAKSLGFDHQGIQSAYRIPYPGCDGFSRYKVFYRDDYQGKKPKYLQRKDTGNHLYIPDSVRAVLKDATTPLYFTEGEKKALKACQEGLYCIGLSGLWNWSDGNKKLIADFNLINLKGRIVYIVPDSDWRDPNKHGYAKNLVQAVYGLAGKLKERQVRVFVVELPEGLKP
ncbi:MAG: DUF3854 domain-containing protein [Syntrophorhabdales bacterium]|jgi:hypothetical protein